MISHAVATAYWIHYVMSGGLGAMINLTFVYWSNHHRKQEVQNMLSALQILRLIGR
jgi:predicted DNA-binding protein with PD1-like motif